MSWRILIADDHAVVRSGLRRLIARQPDLEVVAEADDGMEAVRLALENDVDVAIVDFAMPRKTGLQVTEALFRAGAKTRVLILSMHDNDQYVLAAATAGARGYLLKSDADSSIVAACRAAIGNGAFVLPANTTPAMREQIRLARAGGGRRDLLTRREREVLKLVAEGYSSKEIAEELTIAVKTVDRHRTNIMSKLAIDDRVGLTRYAIRRGLVEP